MRNHLLLSFFLLRIYMNLYLYDDKHKQIINEIEIKNLDEAQRIINFINKSKIVDRYRTLIIAESYRIKYEYGESYIEFDY